MQDKNACISCSQEDGQNNCPGVWLFLDVVNLRRFSCGYAVPFLGPPNDSRTRRDHLKGPDLCEAYKRGHFTERIAAHSQFCTILCELVCFFPPKNSQKRKKRANTCGNITEQIAAHSQFCTILCELVGYLSPPKNSQKRENPRKHMQDCT